jgi:DNA-binding CsgD family transcriptional regulator
MKIRIGIEIALFVILCICGFTQYIFAQSVLSYNPNQYHAARQNWGLTTTKDGTIFFANHQGLLFFDGIRWQLNRLPDESFIRAVEIYNDSIIYSSGYMELGYWKIDDYGEYNYNSLTDKAKSYLNDNIEFWNIAIINNSVYFQSFTKILVYANDTIVPVKTEGSIDVMSKINDKILVAIKNKGIFEINNDKAIPLITDPILQNKHIKFILSYDDNLLIGTADHGIFLWDGVKLTQWNNKWTRYFVENELNRGCVTADGKIVLGSIIDGIVIFDIEGNLLSTINSKNGLSDNTILGIDTDKWQNIWLALDNGVAFISNKYPKSFTVQKNEIGAIYSVVIYDDKLFFGTNHGLFVQNLKDKNSETEIIPETQGQTWDCQLIDDKLWVGHNDGTYLVDKKGVKLLTSQAGGFAIKQDEVNDDLLIQCTYSSLITYKKQGDTYIYNGAIKGFYDLVRYLEIDYHGNIWASHMHKGIYKITTDKLRDSVLNVSYYGKEIFGKDYAIDVFKVENRIVFTTNEQFYTYDDLNDTIIPFDALNSSLGKYKKTHRIINAPNHHYWMICNENIGYFYICQDEITLLKEYPLSVFDNFAKVDKYENIFPIDENKAILCLQNGIAWLNTDINDSICLINDYSPQIREIKVSTSAGKEKFLSLKSTDVKIEHSYNNIYFRFSFPHISNIPVSYQYKLCGLDSDWTDVANAPELNLARLSPGQYTLNIKACDLYNNQSDVCGFSFEILQPWYTSKFAIILYLVSFFVLLFLFHNWGIRQTKKKEQKQHEKREQELIRLRNEKLRTEVKHKSKELANSTMAIIKKNEFLLNIKRILSKQKAELGSRYPDKYYNYLNRKIDENISNQDDWKIFETNFERAHEQFLQKIKEKYPDLTSRDLRLCAYLRMNLPSKEIAPLLGISVRGVENHRFRLRKKFGLDRDESLLDIILSF